MTPSIHGESQTRRDERAADSQVTDHRPQQDRCQNKEWRTTRCTSLAVGNPAAKRPQGAVCGHFAVTEAIEQQRTQANAVLRSPVFSGVFSRVRWPSQEMKVSGRQDLNLRPPGPQREERGADEAREPVFIGLSAPVCLPVLLILFPVLFPGHTFACYGQTPRL